MQKLRRWAAAALCGAAFAGSALQQNVPVIMER